MSITHRKISAIPDEPDTTLVRPSDWNDDHDVTVLVLPVQGTDPASPDAGYRTLYVKSDGLYVKTNSGSVSGVTPSAVTASGRITAYSTSR